MNLEKVEVALDADDPRLHPLPRIVVDLPPYGYRCWTDDGRVLVVSDDVRYFARGDEYEYLEEKK